MRIGIVTTWFERGAAYVSRQYADTLAEKHDVYIYARGGEQQATNDKNWNSYNVSWGDRRWEKGGEKENKKERLEHFSKWVKDNKLDIIFFNEEHSWGAVAACHEMNVKTGAYVDYYTKDTVSLFGAYDFLICNTKRHYSVFDWHPQSFYIPWGTNIKLFKSQSFDLVKSGKLSFFHSAGMSPERKGTDILLRAFFKLQKKHRNVLLVVHTQTSFKERFPKLKKILEEMVGDTTLVMKEETVSAPGLYHLGDVYVYPTRLEGVGLSIMEALASGLPVITSNNGPMNEFVNGKNGQLVRIKRFYERYFDHYYWPMSEADEDDLAAKMEFYVKNIDRIGEYKKNARASAEESMDWSKNTQSIWSAFEETRIIKEKTIVLKKIERLQKIKENIFLKIFYKIRVLKFDAPLVLWDKIKDKIV
ncbi:MAG: glycosyltransferase family 4 protein [Parcubacteria group bacterium]|nr:glycosyltransferase family 4 protein [Parcubacteria group bacterium]